MPSIPFAARIDQQRLLSVIAIPAVAALAMATAVAATGGGAERIAEAGGTVGYLLGFVKFCYLAVGAAHLSGAAAERFNGGLPAGLWLDEMNGDQAVSEVPAGADAFWHAFPNHLDGAAIALGLTLLCWLLG